MNKSLWRKIVNSVMMALTGLSAALAALALLAVLAFVARNGIAALNWDLLSKLPTPVGVPGGGVVNALAGSLIVIGLASLLAVPVGLGAGTYLSEFGRGRFADVVRYLADVLSGVPSIVIGIFAYNLIVSRQGQFSALSGGIALGVMMLPSVVRTTEEMMRMVPDSQREAALALGLTRWRTIASVVLPGARAGVTTGILLAVARVAGETAPLLFTAFGNPYWSVDIREPIATLPHTLFTYAISPYADWQAKAWGTALILTSLMLTAGVLSRRAGRHGTA
ncbi:MAG: phosphate ABC transporter permease PstA [Anaerolineae bacterium]|jgi:phosphate transport system permease protein|nr:phosphate ABC transporter permease PstA [Chloroflexota bacterium]